MIEKNNSVELLGSKIDNLDYISNWLSRKVTIKDGLLLINGNSKIDNFDLYVTKYCHSLINKFDSGFEIINLEKGVLYE